MQVVLWALVTGGVTGGVWIAIVLLGRQRRLKEQYQALLERTDDRVAEMERVHRRVMELGERIDSNEQQLIDQQHRPELPPQ